MKLGTAVADPYVPIPTVVLFKLMTGVVVPVATLIGAVPVTLVTVPPDPLADPTLIQAVPLSRYVIPACVSI